MSDPDARTAERAAPQELGERLSFALRQAALLAVALLVAGAVTERLRPDDTIQRTIAETPWQWTIVVWTALLLFHAVAFDTSRIRELESKPLLAALAIGGVVTIVGLIAVDGGSAARRFTYVLANGVGAALFWWGLLGLGHLVVQAVERPNQNE